MDRLDHQKTLDLVARFYSDLWNRWDLGAASGIVAPDIVFRGSLGTELVGQDAFLEYLTEIRTAFPDWHNQVNELVAAGHRAFARLTWTGTHSGPLKGIAPTYRPVCYVGAGIFRVTANLISDAWIVGDTQTFWQCLGERGRGA